MESQLVFPELEKDNVHLVLLKLDDNDISVIEKSVTELKEIAQSEIAKGRRYPLPGLTSWYLERILSQVTYSVFAEFPERNPANQQLRDKLSHP